MYSCVPKHDNCRVQHFRCMTVTNYKLLRFLELTLFKKYLLSSTWMKEIIGDGGGGGGYPQSLNYTTNQDGHALTQKLSSVLPITHFTPKL